jgi:CBS domain-containing protein
VVCCAIDDTMDRAALLMWDNDCGAIPVVGADGRLAGIVTDRDICMAALFQGRALRDVSVSDAMTRDLATCHPNDSLLDAEHLLGIRQVHRLPVVNERDEPVGMLSVSDIARIAGKNGKGRIGAAPNGEFVSTLAAICEPRLRQDHASAM